MPIGPPSPSDSFISENGPDGRVQIQAKRLQFPNSNMKNSIAGAIATWKYTLTKNLFSVTSHILCHYPPSGGGDGLLRNSAPPPQQNSSISLAVPFPWDFSFPLDCSFCFRLFFNYTIPVFVLFAFAFLSGLMSESVVIAKLMCPCPNRGEFTKKNE